VRNPLASPLWRNQAFVRVWSAASISIFGSLITRIALPLVAILTLGAGPIEVAVLRGVDLGAMFLVGLVAGAWVDRLRRRPVLIWADLGRAVLLGSIPVAFVLGGLAFPQLLIVAASAAVLTVFFDTADNAYLPSIVEREQLVEANGAMSASGSVAEVAGFGLSGILVAAFSGPITILIDAVTYVVSAILLLGIRREEAPPPKAEDREPVLDEIRSGLRRVRHDPVLLALAQAQMVTSAVWGVYGTIWFLFFIEELRLGVATVGVVAAVGGVASFIGAVAAQRSIRRFGIGTIAVGTMLATAIGNILVPLAPAGLPLVALAFLVAAQLIADSAQTMFDIVDVSVRQSRVTDRELGRVGATVSVMSVAVQLAATIAAGLLAEVIGLRPTILIAALAALAGPVILYRSPVRLLHDLPSMDDREPAEVVVEIERERPVGA
jgi:MFS family permease